jgi:hypothetical protein
VRAGLASSAADYEFQGSFVTNVTKTLSGPTLPGSRERRPAFHKHEKKGWGGGRPSEGRRKD